MKIVSDDALLLDELYVELKKEHIKATKETKPVKGAMSGAEVAAAVAIIGMGAEVIEKLINLYTMYINASRINYIHVKYKDGREEQYNNLDNNEFEEIKKQLRLDTDNIEYTKMGKH